MAADIAILAIGFKLGVPFLPEAYRNKLVEPDGQYRLYRVIANPDLPDMGFVGFNSSFCTVLCAEMGANWLVRYCDGQLANQPTAAEMHKNMDMMLHFNGSSGRPRAFTAGCASRHIISSISTNCWPTWVRRDAGAAHWLRNSRLPTLTPMRASWRQPQITRLSRPSRPQGTRAQLL